jgi:hypothetical protein
MSAFARTFAQYHFTTFREPEPRFAIRPRIAKTWGFVSSALLDHAESTLAKMRFEAENWVELRLQLLHKIGRYLLGLVSKTTDTPLRRQHRRRRRRFSHRRAQ